MIEIKTAIVCRHCIAAKMPLIVKPKDMVKHLQQHGFDRDFILAQDVNVHYTVVHAIEDWPEVSQAKKKKKK